VTMRARLAVTAAGVLVATIAGPVTFRPADATAVREQVFIVRIRSAVEAEQAFRTSADLLAAGDLTMSLAFAKAATRWTEKRLAATTTTTTVAP
jgi:hypothetical protein